MRNRGLENNHRCYYHSHSLLSRGLSALFCIKKTTNVQNWKQQWNNWSKLILLWRWVHPSFAQATQSKSVTNCSWPQQKSIHIPFSCTASYPWDDFPSESLNARHCSEFPRFAEAWGELWKNLPDPQNRCFSPDSKLKAHFLWCKETQSMLWSKKWRASNTVRICGRVCSFFPEQIRKISKHSSGVKNGVEMGGKLRE